MDRGWACTGHAAAAVRQREPAPLQALGRAVDRNPVVRAAIVSEIERQYGAAIKAELAEWQAGQKPTG